MVEGWCGKDLSNGKFCNVDTPATADCYLMPQLYKAKRYDFLDLDSFPTLMSGDVQCAQHQAFRKQRPINNTIWLLVVDPKVPYFLRFRSVLTNFSNCLRLAAPGTICSPIINPGVPFIPSFCASLIVFLR